MIELRLSAQNPAPFKQPFLVLHFKGDRSAYEWMIDVEGNIDLYLQDYTAIRDEWDKLPKGDKRRLRILCVWDWQSQVTPLLKEMIAEFAKHNAIVNRVYAYEGSGGPTHILRNGAFFKRVGIEREPIVESWDNYVPFDKWPDVAKVIPLIYRPQRVDWI